MYYEENIILFKKQKQNDLLFRKLYADECKMMRDLLHAILVFKNIMRLHKNTMHFCYIALAMAQPKCDMSWDM